MRRKGKPSLEYERDDAGPIKYGAVHRNFHDHIVPPDVINDKWKGVHKRKEEKGVGDPSVE